MRYFEKGTKQGFFEIPETIVMTEFEYKLRMAIAWVIVLSPLIATLVAIIVMVTSIIRH